MISLLSRSGRASIALLIFLVSPLRAQFAGSLDDDFDPETDGTSGHGLCCVVQPDGNILIGGEFEEVDGQPARNIVRLRPWGSVESTVTFNSGTGANNNVRCLAVQPDGKILVGGEFTAVGGQARGGFARLTRDGTLESTATFDPGTGANEEVRSLAVQPDGKILIGGDFTAVNGEPRTSVARLNANGAPEDAAAFNPVLDGIVRSVVLQPDGKILIGGDFTSVNGQAQRGIARLNADGTADAGFDPGTGVDNSVRSLAVQPDGKVVIVGRFTTVNGSSRNNIARLNPDGTVESTATFNPGTGPDNDVRCVALQANGKILIGGDFTAVDGQPRISIARLRADGALENVTAFRAFTEMNEDVRAIALQPDGKILLVGDFTMVQGEPREGIARLHNDVATASLELPAPSTVRWLRGGSSPEISTATLEVKAAAAPEWTPLGAGQRTAGGWAWNLTGVTLPALGTLRARGVAPAGHGSSIVQSVLALGGFAAPGVSVRVPGGDDLISGSSEVPFGADYGTNARTFPLLVQNTGTATLANLAVSFTGPHAADFTLSSSLPTALAPQQVFPLAIRFAAGGPGERSAALRLTHSFPGSSPFVLALSGIRTDTLTPFFPDAATPLLTRDGFIAEGIAFGPLTLGFAPVPGEYLTVIHNTGTLPIAGRFGGLPDGGRVTADYGGRTFTFVASYSGGTGNDLVLVPVFTSPGAMDTEFKSGFDGARQVLEPGTVHAIAVQPDGMTVIGGYFSRAGGVLSNGLARFHPDGSLEEGFNPLIEININSLAVQADGKIIAAESLYDSGGVERKLLVRFHPDGSRDDNFNPLPDRYTNCMAVQPDGKIIIGGSFTMVAGAARQLLARLHSSGAPDAGFNPGVGGGSQPLSPFVHCLAVQEDGKILLGGRFGSVAGALRNNIARLHPDGSLDTAFNPGANDFVSQLAIQADGKIILAGSFSIAGAVAREGIARLHPDGTPDLGFIPPTTGLSASGLAIQADGKILIGATRLHPDGTVDQEFRAGPFEGGGGPQNVTLQANGGVLVVGPFRTVGGFPRASFARLHNDPATASLANSGFAAVRWMRGGSSPEVNHVSFEVKAAGAVSWTPLGSGHRIAGGWELGGISLPPAGEMRATGRAGGSLYGSIGPILSVLEQWRRLHFGSPLNSGSAADVADPDADTIPNLVEFALGLDPNRDSLAQLPGGRVIGSDFILSVTQPAGVSGITIGAESSSTLLPGSWSAVPDTGIPPEHIFRVPISEESSRFLRLKVTVP